MPLYTFNCPQHGEFDRLYRMEDKPEAMACPSCGAPSRSIITLGHGGPRRNDSGWLKEVNAFFRPDGIQFESVPQYRDYLTQRSDLSPKEGHPAIPSSIGDRVKKPPSWKELETKRRKMAHDRLRDMRRLTVNTRSGQPPAGP